MKTLIICLIILSYANFAYAEPGDIMDKTVTITWTANTEKDLAGYKIYHQKIFLVDIPDPQLTIFEVIVEDLVEGENIFNMTAYDTSGNESGFSADAVFSYDSIAPAAPTGVKVQTTQKTRVTIETWE